MLQLNTDKTKCMDSVSPPQLRQLKYSTFNAGGEIVELALSARNLGIILDSMFSDRSHYWSVQTVFSSTEKFIPT